MPRKANNPGPKETPAGRRLASVDSSPNESPERKECNLKIAEALKLVQKELSELRADLNRVSEKLECITDTNEDILNELKTTKKENTELRQENENLKKLVNQNAEKINDLEQWTRRSSVRITGIPDEPKEDYEQSEERVIGVLRDKMNVQISKHDIDIAHRVGTFNEVKCRPILVKFASRKKKLEVYKEKKKLKGSRIFVNEDLTRQNALLYKQIRDLPETQFTWTKEGKIFTKGENGRVVMVSRNTRLEELRHDLTTRDTAGYDDNADSNKD